MWAKNEQGTIKRYIQLPQNYKNHIGFDRMGSEVHDQEGFFALVEPDHDRNLQECGDIIWDEANNQYIYQVNDKVIDIEAEKARHMQTLSDTIKEISGIVSAVKNVYDPLRKNLDNFPAEFESLVDMILPLRQQAIDEINALSTPEEVVTYVVRGPMVEGYIEQLKSFM